MDKSALRVKLMKLFLMLISLFLFPFTEDHDLHHRMGSRQSFNYGKQTRRECMPCAVLRTAPFLVHGLITPSPQHMGSLEPHTGHILLA